MLELFGLYLRAQRRGFGVNLRVQARTSMRVPSELLKRLGCRCLSRGRPHMSHGHISFYEAQ